MGNSGEIWHWVSCRTELDSHVVGGEVWASRVFTGAVGGRCGWAFLWVAVRNGGGKGEGNTRVAETSRPGFQTAILAVGGRL